MPATSPAKIKRSNRFGSTWVVHAPSCEPMDDPMRIAIAQKQAIAFMLAEMALEIDATRLLTWEAAWKLDRGEDATREAYLAKNYAANMVLKVTDNAVQVLGGHGYIREHPVEMWLRNGRGFATFEGMVMV